MKLMLICVEMNADRLYNSNFLTLELFKLLLKMTFENCGVTDCFEFEVDFKFIDPYFAVLSRSVKILYRTYFKCK